MADNQDIQQPSERIEAYLRRWMSPEEEISFEEELRADPDLMQQLDAQLQEMAQSQWVGMQEHVKQFDQQFDAAQFDYSQLRKLRIRNGIFIGVGATVAITAAIFIGLSLRKPTEPEPQPEPELSLFDQSFEVPLFIPASEVSSNLSQEQQALRQMVSLGDSSFINKDFSSAISSYSLVPKEFLPEAEQGRISFLQAAAYLQSEKADSARIFLDQAKQNATTDLAPFIHWYHALSWIKEEMWDSAAVRLRVIAQEPLNPFNLQAQRLLGEVESQE